jgi:hypothetical protein
VGGCCGGVGRGRLEKRLSAHWGYSFSSRARWTVSISIRLRRGPVGISMALLKLFLNFEKISASCSYKLGSYKKKKCIRLAIRLLDLLQSPCYSLQLNC